MPHSQTSLQAVKIGSVYEKRENQLTDKGRGASEKRRGIADAPDKTKQMAIVFEPPMRKSSEKQDVVNGGDKEKENPIAPV